LAIIDEVDLIKLTANTSPTMGALSVGEMHSCWRLPVTLA